MINTRSLTESLERKYNLSTDESLNEAQLNENPLLAAAARAVAPVVIDAAANKLSDVIDAKLSEDVVTEGTEYAVGDNETEYNLIETWDEEFEDEADYIMGSNLSDEEKSQEMNKLLNKYNRMNEDANLNEAQFPWEYRNGGKEYSIKDVAKSLNNLRNVFNSVAEIISSFGWSDGDEELSSTIDELFAEDYPFDKDFMEINMDVDNWVFTFIENASKIK